MKSCPTCKITYPSRFTMCPQDGAKLVETSQWADGAIIRGKYRILSKLGQGGMGAVYKASHMVFDELRALKVINAELISDELFVKRFKQEAVIARKLHHPNAVRVDDLDESEDGLPFIVMEYIEGRSLKDLIEKEGPVDPHRAVRIASQVASALDAAHSLGMVHRDIKPANIVLIESPAGEEAKVLDFGIAKIKDARSAESSGMTLTGTGIVVGTPQYMSPEQALGKRGSDLDGRSDLYSLGVVMYQMLAGQLPFKADTTMQILLAHINSPPRPILEVRPHSSIPPALASVVMNCLEKDPQNRPASGAKLIEALAASESGESVSPTLEAEDLSSATQVLQHPAPPLEEATIEQPTLSAAATVKSSTNATTRSPIEERAKPAERSEQSERHAKAVPAQKPGRAGRESRKGLIGGVIAALIVIGVVAGYVMTHRHTPGPRQSVPAVSTSAPRAIATAQPSSSNAASQAPAQTAGPPQTTTANAKPAPATHASVLAKPQLARGMPPNRASVAATRKTLANAPAAQAQPATLVAKATPPPAARSGNPSLATLIITTAPGAQIFMDGRAEGVANSSGKLTVPNLPPGTHSLKAALAGFNDIEYTVQLPPGATSFVNAKWGATQSTVAAAQPNSEPSAAHNAPRTGPPPVAASFPVVYLHTFGSSRGLLVIDNGNVHYQPSNGRGAFISPISGVSWGRDGRRTFYIRLEGGQVHRFRSPATLRILATLQRAAGAVGRPSLAQ